MAAAAALVAKPAPLDVDEETALRVRQRGGTGLQLKRAEVKRSIVVNGAESSDAAARLQFNASDASSLFKREAVGNYNIYEKQATAGCCSACGAYGTYCDYVKRKRRKKKQRTRL